MSIPYWAFSVKSNDKNFAFLTAKRDEAFSLEAISESSRYGLIFEEKDIEEFQFHKTIIDRKTWVMVAKYVLLGDVEEDKVIMLYDDLRLECNCSQDSLVLTIKQTYRTSMGDVDAILGAISLEYQASVSLNDSIKFLYEFGQILQAKQTAFVISKHELRGLRVQANELIQAKQEYEKDLLDKFAALLNEKKIKINELMGYASENLYITSDEATTIKKEDVQQKSTISASDTGGQSSYKEESKISKPSSEDKKSSTVIKEESRWSQQHFPLSVDANLDHGKRPRSPSPSIVEKDIQDIATEDESTDNESTDN